MANLMKKGQILSGVHHKGKAIIVNIGNVKIEIKWFLDARGNPMSDNTRSHSIKELQKEIESKKQDLDDQIKNQKEKNDKLKEDSEEN